MELEEKGIPFSANVTFDNIWGTQAQKIVLLETYAQQLDRLVDYYVAHPGLVPARIIDVKLEHLSQEAHITRSPGGECLRWCGAGHEMIAVNVDGTRAPCHRFSPWITGRPVPENPVNRQNSWKPDKCAECKLISLCPTCAGFNWQENGDSGIRTTYHCEAFKLEAIASAKLQVLRLAERNPDDLRQLSPEEALKIKRQLDVILEMNATGV